MYNGCLIYYGDYLALFRPPDLPLKKPVCRSRINRTGYGTTD